MHKLGCSQQTVNDFIQKIKRTMMVKKDCIINKANTKLGQNIYKTGQTNEKTDRHERRTVAHLEISNMSVDNTGPPDKTYLYYSHVDGVTLKGSLLPA